jgi:hypothetical protein
MGLAVRAAIVVALPEGVPLAPRAEGGGPVHVVLAVPAVYHVVVDGSATTAPAAIGFTGLMAVG